MRHDLPRRMNMKPHSSMFRLSRLFFSVVLMASSLTAVAGTATTTFNVSAIVAANCLVSANDLSFPAYTPGGGVITASTTLEVRCTKNTPFKAGLNEGNTGGSTITQRLLNDGGSNTLEYNLYSVPYSTIWGNSPGTDTVDDTGSGMSSPKSYTVYGRLLDSANNQNAVPGTYSDILTVTVNF